MNSGWIPYRRGLIDHLIGKKRLNTSEFAAFSFLLLKADAATGSGDINGAMLRTFFPDMSKDTSQRVLASLEQKKLIWRDNPTHSCFAYVYWVNKFECTHGSNKLRITDLSQVFETNDIRHIKYTDPAHHMQHHMQHQTTHQTTHQMSDSYNKDTETDKDKDTTTVVSGEATKRSGNVIQQIEARNGGAKLKQGLKREKEAEPEAAIGSSNLKPASRLTKIRWQGGEACGWFSGTKRITDYQEVNQALAPVGLEWKNSKLFDTGGHDVPWEDALARIERSMQ
jgi:hypothetical protein